MKFFQYFGKTKRDDTRLPELTDDEKTGIQEAREARQSSEVDYQKTWDRWPIVQREGVKSRRLLEENHFGEMLMKSMARKHLES